MKSHRDLGATGFLSVPWVLEAANYCNYNYTRLIFPAGRCCSHWSNLLPSCDHFVCQACSDMISPFVCLGSMVRWKAHQTEISKAECALLSRWLAVWLWTGRPVLGYLMGVRRGHWGDVSVHPLALFCFQVQGWMPWDACVIATVLLLPAVCVTISLSWRCS